MSCSLGSRHDPAVSRLFLCLPHKDPQWCKFEGDLGPRCHVQNPGDLLSGKIILLFKLTRENTYILLYFPHFPHKNIGSIRNTADKLLFQLTLFCFSKFLESFFKGSVRRRRT
jgi:hypothetical protein